MQFDAKQHHTQTEYMLFIAWLTDTAVASLEGAKRNPSLIRAAIQEYLRQGYNANLTSGELTDFFCVDAPSVLDRAGFTDAEAGDATAVFNQLNTKSHDALETLSRLASAEHSGVYLNPPCTAQAIAEIQLAAQRAFGKPLPAGVVRLLTLSDGCQINGVYFHKAAELIERLNHHGGMILLGDEDTAYFVFDEDDGKFHILLEGDTEKFKSFDAFEDMLLYVMKDEGVV